jgi:hypothetical protein
MNWTDQAVLAALALVTVYLIWYVFRGRSASGVGAPRPSLDKALQAFVMYVGGFYLLYLAVSAIGWSEMRAAEMIWLSLVIALSDYLIKLTLYYKGRAAAKKKLEG